MNNSVMQVILRIYKPPLLLVLLLFDWALSWQLNESTKNLRINLNKYTKNIY